MQATEGYMIIIIEGKEVPRVLALSFIRKWSQEFLNFGMKNKLVRKLQL